MKFDSYSRFLKSSLYQECLRAEVEGQPLPEPFQIPCSPAPSKHSASSDRSTLSTPKKVPVKNNEPYVDWFWWWTWKVRSTVLSLVHRNQESRNPGSRQMKTPARVQTRNGGFSFRGPVTGALGRVQRRRTSGTLIWVRIIYISDVKQSRLSTCSSSSCCADYYSSNGRRESQGSLSSSASLEIPISSSTAKIEVRFLWWGLHGNTEPRVWWSQN